MIDIEQFVQDGWTILRGAVPSEVVGGALKRINVSLAGMVSPALGGYGVSPTEAEAYAELYRKRGKEPPAELASAAAAGSGLQGSFEVMSSPEVMALFHETQVAATVASMVGPIAEVAMSQVALRFPDAAEPLVSGPHLDGYSTPTNLVQAGELESFTLLVGVLLTDTPEPNMGNFTVWTGSHASNAAWFQDHEPVPDIDQAPSMPGEGTPICGRAGDVVLAHYLTGHTVGPNTSPLTRYVVFFRVTHADHDARKRRAFSDPWLEYDGILARR